MSDKLLSSKHALDAEELAFCTKIAAGLPMATAYRRIWPEECEGRSAKMVYKRAERLAREPHIAAFLEDLTQSPQDLARVTVQESMLLGDPISARAAAKMVLEDADLMGKMSDFERFWHIAAACGAVVVKRVGEQEVQVPVRELIPQFKDAVPPQEVQRKTAASLMAWYDKLEAQAEELDIRERNLRVDA